MKLYRLLWREPGEGERYAWHASRSSADRDADRVRADWPDVHPDDLDLQTEIEDIPTTKAGLLRWLNVYVTYTS